MRALCGALALLLCVAACALAEPNAILQLSVGESVKGGLKGGDHQMFETSLSSESHAVDDDNNFLHYLLESNQPGVCVSVMPPDRGLPTELHYLRENCTTESMLTVDVRLPSHLFTPGVWHAGVFNLASASAVYALAAVNTTGPDVMGCPPLRPGAVAGPYRWRNYCWYLTLEGATCDATCHALGGNNLIDYAIQAFDRPTDCPPSCPDEPVSFFMSHGNPFQWRGLASDSQHRSLGYGESFGQAACHCGARNSATGIGALVGDHNTDRSRALVCACFKNNQ